MEYLDTLSAELVIWGALALLSGLNLLFALVARVQTGVICLQSRHEARDAVRRCALIQRDILAMGDDLQQLHSSTEARLLTLESERRNPLNALIRRYGHN